MDDDLRDDLDADGGGGSGGKKGLPTIVIVIIIAAVMGIGGFFAGKMISGGKEEPAQNQTVDQGDSATGENGASKKTTKKPKKKQSATQEEDDLDEPTELVSRSKSGVLVMDPFTVNLNDPFGRRYAEILMNLEIKDKQWVAKISENELLKPKMRDEIFMIISAKSYNELKSTSGKVTLKEEIMMRVNEILRDEYDVEPVTGVYFSKFLIQ